MLNKEQFAKDFARLHASYEKQAYTIIKRSLDAQSKLVTAYLQKSESNVLLLNVLLPQLIDAKLTESAYIQLYSEIGVRHARHYARFLDKLTTPQKHGLPLLETKQVAFSSEYWREVMASYFRTEAAWKVTEVDTYTINRIQKLLSEAQLQNLSLREQAKYLTKNLSDARFNSIRAMVIARTESTSASNTAASKVAEAADFEVKKSWSVRVDGRERRSHRIVGAKDPIPLNENFELINSKGGTEYGMYPGAATLSAELVVQCRCAVIHEPVLDDLGLPIARR
jgi:hypothetical protein